MSQDESLGSPDRPLTEARIERLIELCNRTIAAGISAPIALAALEVHLVKGLKALELAGEVPS